MRKWGSREWTRKTRQQRSGWKSRGEAFVLQWSQTPGIVMIMNRPVARHSVLPNVADRYVGGMHAQGGRQWELSTYAPEISSTIPFCRPWLLARFLYLSPRALLMQSVHDGHLICAETAN